MSNLPAYQYGCRQSPVKSTPAESGDSPRQAPLGHSPVFWRGVRAADGTGLENRSSILSNHFRKQILRYLGLDCLLNCPRSMTAFSVAFA